MNPAYTTSLEVRGYELDGFGHVNHAHYLHYLEVARWKMLEAEGVTLQTFRQHSRWPVIAGVEIQYLKPTFMGDQLTVETRLEDYRRSSMKISQVILRDGIPVARAQVRSVIVDDQGKPAALPEELEPRWRKIHEHSRSPTPEGAR